MENRWLLIWLLAPFFSPAAMAVESYSLYWYRLDADTSPATIDRNQNDRAPESVRSIDLGTRARVAR